MNKRNIREGGLFIGGLVAIITLAVFTVRHGLFPDSTRKKITFDASDVTGLRVGSEVKLKGQRIGRVIEIKLTKSTPLPVEEKLKPNSTPPPEQDKPAFTVTAEIEKEYEKSWGDAKQYSKGELTSETVVSPIIILLIPKSDESPVSNPDPAGNTKLDEGKNQVTPTPMPADRGANTRLSLTKKPDIFGTVTDLSGPINQAIGEVNKTLSTLNKISDELHAAIKPKIGNDGKPQEIKDDASLESMVSHLSQVSANLDKILAVFVEQTGKSADSKPPPTVIHDMARDLREACGNLNKLSTELAAPDGKLYKKLSDLSGNLDNITSDLSAPKGNLRKEIEGIIAKISKAVADIDASTAKAVADIDASTTKALDNIDTGVTSLKKGHVGWFLGLGGSNTPNPSPSPSPTPTRTKGKKSTTPQTPGKRSNGQ